MTYSYKYSPFRYQLKDYEWDTNKLKKQKPSKSKKQCFYHRLLTNRISYPYASYPQPDHREPSVKYNRKYAF